MIAQRATPMTLHDLKFMRDVLTTVRSYDASYAASPDPLYASGRKFGPQLFDPAYKEVLAKNNETSNLAYMVDLLEGMPNLTTFGSYINEAAMKAAGRPDTKLTKAFYEGVWVATLIEYLDLVCPCIYQKTVQYVGGPRPITAPASNPIYGSLFSILMVTLDKAKMLLRGKLESHHLEGPLPYFDDFIGALYTEDDKSSSYSEGAFMMDIGKLCHDNRDGLWRLDETIVHNPYMTQFGVFLKDEGVPASNTPGTLSSAIWLNDWDELKGKVHSPTSLLCEDWYVMFNMIPHSDMTTIMTRAADTITVNTTTREYVWYEPAATPWMP